METYAYILRTLAHACVWTVTVTIAAFVIAFVLGSILAIITTLSSRDVRYLIYAYVELFRNTPVLVQLFIIYFGLGQIGFKLSPYSAAALGLGMNGSATVFEIVRSSLKAVDRGQYVAAAAIGMTRIQSIRYVIIPQALRIALPSVGNYAVGLVKDTSLASAVAVPELAFRARNLVGETYLSTQIYLIVAAIYFVLSLPLMRLASRLEMKLSSGRHKNA